MSFMEPQIEKGIWVKDESGGYHYVPAWGARLSAPGYLDCTEWCVFDTEAEAAQYLLDTYYDQPDDEMSEDEKEEREWLEELASQ